MRRLGLALVTVAVLCGGLLALYPWRAPGPTAPMSERSRAPELGNSIQERSETPPVDEPGRRGLEGDVRQLGANGQSQWAQLRVVVVNARGGRPVCNARVELPGHPGTGVAAPTITGPDGVAFFPRLRPGRARVLATWPAGAAQSWASTDVELPEGDQLITCELRLSTATGSIVGFVRDASGQPIAAATVSLVLPAVPFVDSDAYRDDPYVRVLTTTDGAYRLDPVSSDRAHNLAAGAPGYSGERRWHIAVHEGESTRLDFVLARNRVLRGLVELPPGARPAWVHVVPAIVMDPDWIPGQPVHEAGEFYVLQPAAVPPSGTFEIEVPAGATGVVVLAAAEGLAPTWRDVDARSLDVGRGQQDPPDVRLRLDTPGIVLAGSVVDASGHGIAAEIEFVDPETQFVHASAMTDATGRFACRSLRHGQYTCAVRERNAKNPRSAIVRNVVAGQSELRLVVRERD